MRSHRIPKFLTNPWKTSDGKFKVFSFKEKKISTENANHFFAEDDIFTQEEEEFYNKNIETPLADFLNNTSNTKTIKKSKNIKVKSWKHIKAMHLLLISILERSSWHKGKKSSDFNVNDFEHSMIRWNQENGLMILDASVIDQKYKLMFPEYGFCPIVFLTKERKPCVTSGVPILGDKILITYKKNQHDPEDIKKLAVRGDFLLKVSVSNVGDKVIIHPEILKYTSEQEMSQILLETRKNYCDYIDLCKELAKEQRKLLQVLEQFL